MKIIEIDIDAGTVEAPGWGVSDYGWVNQGERVVPIMKTLLNSLKNTDTYKQRLSSNQKTLLNGVFDYALHGNIPLVNVEYGVKQDDGAVKFFTAKRLAFGELWDGDIIKDLEGKFIDSDPTEADSMLKKVAERAVDMIGFIADKQPSFFIDNHVVAEIVNQGYKFADFSKKMSNVLVDEMISVFDEKMQYTVDLDQSGGPFGTNFYEYVDPHVSTWTSPVNWSLGTNGAGLTSVEIPGAKIYDFNGTGEARQIEDFKQNVTLKPLAESSILYLKGISNSKIYRDSFVKSAKSRLNATLRDKDLATYELTIKKTDWSIWGWIKNVFSTTNDFSDSTMQAVAYAAYAHFIMKLIEAQNSGDRKISYNELTTAWNEASTGGFYRKVIDLLFIDKEITRRIHLWGEFKKLSEDENYSVSGGRMYKVDDPLGSQLDKDLGESSGEAFGSGDVKDVDDTLTGQEIEDRQRFFKQCALMLNAHYLKGFLTSRVKEEMTSGKTPVPFNGRFWMAKCQEDQERLIGNLVASSDAATFFDVPPPVLTALTPKFRLYRVANQDADSKASGPKETEFIFGQFADINRKQNYTSRSTSYLSSPFDKGSGAGVKEFSFEFNGTTPATARKDIKATLKLHFQSFNDFIRERVSDNGETYRFVDLIIQPSPDSDNKVNNVTVVHPNQYDPTFYRIRAEVGYYPPTPGVPYSKLTELEDAIEQTNKSFFLCMVDHDLQVNVDGTVDISISYQAYIETALKSLRFDALTTPELVKKRKQVNEGLADLLDSGVCTKKQIKDYKAGMQGLDKKLREESLQSIIQRLLDRDRMYVVQVKNSDKDKFYKNGYFSSCRFVKINSEGKEIVVTESDDPADALKDASEEDKLLGTVLEKDLPDLEDYNYTDPEDSTVQFFFFGDLLHTIMDTMYDPDRGGAPAVGLEKTKFILGSLDFDPYNDNETLESPINLAQLPISVDYFSEWFVDMVIKKGETRKSYPIVYFVRDLCNRLLKNSMLEACVNRKIGKTMRFATGQISAYANDASVDPLLSLAKSQIIIDTQSASSRSTLPLKGDSDGNTGSKIENFYNYIVLNVLGSSLTHTGNGNYGKDIEKGRYHVNIGSNRGIVKTVQFEKSDIQYIREARYMQQGIDGLLQLSNVYNATVEMFGNTLFYPGMELFINPFGIGGTELGSPTWGPSHSGGRSMANILGLGGYHTITSVITSLTPANFKTTVKALQYYSGDDQPNPNLRGRLMSEKKIDEITKEDQTEEEKAYCVAYLDALMNLGEEEEWEVPTESSVPAVDESPAEGETTPDESGPTSVEEVRPESESPFTEVFEYTYDADADEQSSGTVTFEYTEKKPSGNGFEFHLDDVLVATQDISENVDDENIMRTIVVLNILQGTNKGRYESEEVVDLNDIVEPEEDQDFEEEIDTDIPPPTEPPTESLTRDEGEPEPEPEPEPEEAPVIEPEVIEEEEEVSSIPYQASYFKITDADLITAAVNKGGDGRQQLESNSDDPNVTRWLLWTTRSFSSSPSIQVMGLSLQKGRAALKAIGSTGGTIMQNNTVIRDTVVTKKFLDAEGKVTTGTETLPEDVMSIIGVTITLENSDG